MDLPTLRSRAVSLPAVAAITSALLACSGGQAAAERAPEQTASSEYLHPVVVPAAELPTARPARPRAALHAIMGRVRFSGTAPTMPVPAARAHHIVCQDHPVAHNAVVVKDGGLGDVYLTVLETPQEAPWGTSNGKGQLTAT